MFFSKGSFRLRKEFLNYNTVRNNAISLAYKIYLSFGLPDVIYISLRGGAYLGNVLSEYFKILAHPQKVSYAAVVANSYLDKGRRGRIKIEGWTYPPHKLKNSAKLLLVDDIFDTGETINYLASYLLRSGLKRENMAIVVHDYKERLYEKKTKEFEPDFYCRKHVLERPEDDFWIHYLSHELKNLTVEEQAFYYLSEDSSLIEAFALINNKFKKDTL